MVLCVCLRRSMGPKLWSTLGWRSPCPGHICTAAGAPAPFGAWWWGILARNYVLPQLWGMVSPAEWNLPAHLHSAAGWGSGVGGAQDRHFQLAPSAETAQTALICGNDISVGGVTQIFSFSHRGRVVRERENIKQLDFLCSLNPGWAMLRVTF